MYNFLRVCVCWSLVCALGCVAVCGMYYRILQYIECACTNKNGYTYIYDTTTNASLSQLQKLMASMI